jgi:hypothetical protein|tara:strand:+ start:3931 stop:4260 length:330 start_codon:yes stop_codon:yes gene_type:complete
VANVYKNAKVDFTNTDNTTVYTVPSNSRAILKNILVSDDSGSGDSITVTLTDASAAVFSLFKTKTIGSNATTELITQPIILQESEILKAQATTAARLHMVVSLLEINRD